jgi:DNA-binding NtrC family response regulator/tetratricopeptide (TPR) repeat protein
MQPAAWLDHHALVGAETDSSRRPLLACRLSARVRYALLLEAAGLLSLLEVAGWCWLGSWTAATADSCGRLRVDRSAIAPGKPSELPQVVLRELLRLLFPFGESSDGPVGRGEAVCAAREMSGAWQHSLVRVSPDLAAAQILAAAPFLWSPAFAAHRTSLLGLYEENGEGAVWIAGRGRFRRLLLAEAYSREAAEARLSGPFAEEAWWGTELPVRLLAGDGREGALAGWRRHRPSLPEDRKLSAAALFALGRFESAIEALRAVPGPSARVLKLRCQVQLGQLRGARDSLRFLARSHLEASDLVETADAAVRVLANLGRSRASRPWVERALAASRRGDVGLAARAEVVAALAAWDAGDRVAQAEHLARAKAGIERDPVARRRWHQARGLLALNAGDGGAASAELRAALGFRRRELYQQEAAALWNDLGVGRSLAGDLAGAERAFLHAVRLFASCEGPRSTTLALHNLAEIRLRRGRLAGVREVLEKSAEENRRSGNLRALAQDAELLALYELATGRASAALSICERAATDLERAGLEWHRDELSVLRARALGWLGRPTEARECLRRLSSFPVDSGLEPEELPALWAHAGDFNTAAQEASRLERPLAALWTACLERLVDSGPEGGPPELLWASLSGLPLNRRARLVYDLDLLVPAEVPADIRLGAAATFRSLGAVDPVARLGRDESGPWLALVDYLRAPGPGLGALRKLMTAAGDPDTELFWTSEPGERPAGSLLSEPLNGGLLSIRARSLNEPLRAFFALAVRDLASPTPAQSKGPYRGRSASTEQETLPTMVHEAKAGDVASRGVHAGGMLGASPAFHAVRDRLARLAGGELPVLILGETGTGKELAARHVHRCSGRSTAPFVAVNCGALSETLLLADLFGHVRGAFTGAERDRVGVFESAHGGSVFLDEVGDLPASAQAMLLRVLQEGEVRRLGESSPRRVNVRTIAATHRDLSRAVHNGSFRADLLFRLRVGVVELPPLRERGDDISLLIDHILQSNAAASERRVGLTPEARTALLQHSWPGNIRELENRLRLALSLADGEIEVRHLELEATATVEGSYHQQLVSFRRRLVAQSLANAEGNQAAAARRLGLSRQALSYLVRQLGLG